MRLQPLALLCAALALGAAEPAPIRLPAAPMEGASLARALKARATARALQGPGLSLDEASQLLWAAQGENRPGKRTVPSARAKYPLQVLMVTAGGQGLGPGTYRYVPSGHTLTRTGDGTPAGLLGPLKGMQGWIREAPAVFVVAGDAARIDPARTPAALAFTYYEGGAAAQALLLQAAALNLGAGTAAGVDLVAVAQALRLEAGTQVLALLPVGRVRP